MHYATNFHDISSAFLSIHSVTIAYTLLWLLNVLGEMGTDFADHHLLLRCTFLYATRARCAGSRAGIRLFLHLRGVDASLDPLGRSR